MSRDPRGSPRPAPGPAWITPRNLLVAGIGVNAAALLLALALGDRLVPLRVVLILTGLVLALVGVNHRLRNFAEAMEERATTAAYLALGAAVVLLAYLASDAAWDSFRLVLAVFVGVGLAGAVVVLVPLMLRRALIVALVLLHFAGILTAVFSVPPPSGVGCWLTGTLWTCVFRPYLQFMYLNNAYHFYSPEPGPATLLWFRVSYADPKAEPQWVQFPRREDYASRLAYQRALALTESTTYASPAPPRNFLAPDGPVGAAAGGVLGGARKIPYPPEMQPDTRVGAFPDLSQYREPNDTTSKKYIAAYARHVAHDPKYRSPQAPDVPVATVQVYRVLHRILSAPELAAGTDPRGADPEEPTKLLPVYVGKFDADGRILDGEDSEHPDPLLYWVVPIVLEKNAAGETVLRDYVSVHAGAASSPAGK